MPHVEGRATKLKTIINDHKEPLNEHLQDLRGKVNSHIMGNSVHSYSKKNS